LSVRKNYRLNNTEVEYISNYAKQHDCTDTEALRRILKEHSQSHENSATNFLIKEIADGVCETLDKLFTRMRLGVNNADKNSQIIIELLNSIYANNPDYFFIEKKQEATEKANEVVRKRIENFRVQRLDKENGCDK
jgi:hypothetical protein